MPNFKFILGTVVHVNIFNFFPAKCFKTKGVTGIRKRKDRAVNVIKNWSSGFYFSLLCIQ